MELIGEAHLDVAEDNYKVVPLRDGILLLIGPHYVNIIKLGDSVLYSLQLDDNKRNIIRYLPASNKILHVGKDNTVKILSPTSQGVFVLGDIVNDSSVRLSFQESIYLLETLQDSDLNWGPDTEDISQRVAYQLQQRIPELQLLPAKKQPWSECVLEGDYAELEPLFEDISSQPISDPDQSATITKLLHRLRLNSIHHSKHPSTSPVVSVAVSATEEVAVTGASDGSISIWDISNGVRLMNTVSGPAGLTEVLLGEELISIHHPNTIVVHQIGEQALSETLFQHQVEGANVMGASYVAATRTLVLALDDVIGSPAKADYYLQSASVNIEDRSLELGDRVRVEGGFVAIAATNGTNTLSITQDGFVVLFDSSSSTISNSFKKPESTYRFSDITSYNGFVYAATLGGTILSFNLANITQRSSAPSSPSSPSSPLSPVAPAFQGFTSADNGKGDEDPFGGFSSAQDSNLDGDFGSFSSAQESKQDDDFGSFSSAQDTTKQADNEDPFGNFSSAQDSKQDDDFGSFSSAQDTKQADNEEPFGGFSSAQSPKPDEDFGFGDFAAVAPSSPLPTTSKTNATTPPKTPHNELDEFEFESSFSPAASTSLSATEFSPKFSFDAPGAGIAGSVAAHNSSTGDFGELPQAGSNHNSPKIGTSKLRQSRDAFDFPASPYASPSLQKREAPAVVPPAGDLGDFGEFSKSSSSPVVESRSPHPEPFASDLKATSPQRSPQILNETNFGDYGTHNQFGEFGSAQNSSTGSEQLGGDFGSQGSLGDFGAIPSASHPNGTLAPSPTQVPTSTQGDFGDLGDFSTPSNQQTGGDFGEFSSTQQNTSDFDDFGLSNSSSSTSLHASAGHPASAPTTPSLLSTNIQSSGSLFPTSPSVFSQNNFSGFEAPPAQLSPSPLRHTSSSPFDDFGGDFGSTAHSSPPTQRVQTPTLVNTPPRSPLQTAQTSPQRTQLTPTSFETFGDSSPKQEGLGDFGEFSATQQTEENKGDFGDFGDLSESSPATTQEQFSSDVGDFGENPATTGDIGQSVESNASPSGDFGEFSAPAPVQQDSFDDFSEPQPAAVSQQSEDDFGDFGEKPTTQTDDIGDFGEKPASAEDDFGDFGERPAASTTEDDFGDFGESPAAPQAAADDVGDFGESSAPATTEDDFGDFGDFSQSGEIKKEGEEDDFGDFGDFSAPQATGGDDDFGDFGDFSAAGQASEDFGDFEVPSDAAAPAEVPTPAPTPVAATPAPVVPSVPSTPSVFTLEGKELSDALTTTFATAFSSLIPSSTAPSSPSARTPEGLDLEASLKDSQKSPGSARKHACARCGVLMRIADASCLACGASVGNASASTWSGVVLPPIAEIKFWDALGVSIKSMTEKPKEPAALSSSQGILTPAVLTPSTSQSSIPATQPPTLSSSWDFNENPFSPGRVSGTPAAVPASTAAATPSSAASARVPASHAQSSAQGLLTPSHGNANANAPAANASQAPPAQTFTDFSAFGSSSSSTSPFPASATSSSSTTSVRSPDDDFFLSFTPSTTPAPATKSPSLLATSTPSTSPWTQFINRIPDLSFVVADKLVTPSH